MLKISVKCHEHGEELTCSMTNNILYVDPLSCSECAALAKDAGRGELLKEQAEMMGEKANLGWRQVNNMARLACGLSRS